MIDSLGDRIKLKYEHAYRHYLPGRMPVIIRVDGKAFHTLTRGMEKPFDPRFTDMMNKTAQALMENIQGAELAYVQSDEISVLVHNYKRFTSSAWFDNNIQKMVSVAAAIATATFTLEYGKPAMFDARAFVLPEAEVNNYFLWRQQDATRNSINAVAQSLYSHKELMGKNLKETQELIFQRGQNWNDYPTGLKRGRCVVIGGALDEQIPIFSEDPDYVNRHLEVLEK